MKIIKYLLILITMISMLGCKKATNLDVEEYIRLLRLNQYNALNLPAFSPEDIPALLQYRNDTQIVSVFPRNSISSLLGPNCKLGVYVLWTIESIRAISINSKYLNGTFPSQNPLLKDRNSTALKLEMDYNNQAYNIAAQAYFDWWENNKLKDYNDFKNIDPLEKTNYEWH